MRLVEKCSCGASIEITWVQPRSEYNGQARAEAARSKEEIKAFRARHKKCGVLAPLVAGKETTR